MRLNRSGDDTNWSICDRAINDNNKVDLLVGPATCRNVDASLAIVDLETLIQPAPTPKLTDRSGHVIECNFADYKLLIANLETDVASIEDQVIHEVGGTCFSPSVRELCTFFADL